MKDPWLPKYLIKTKRGPFEGLHEPFFVDD